MSNKEIIIRITNESVFFNPGLNIPLEYTNIPSDFLVFRSHSPIYWKVEMLEFEDATATLKVKVTEYNCTKYSSFKDQKPKKQIKLLLFDRFDWKELELLLTSYQKIKLHEILFNIDADPFSKGIPEDKFRNVLNLKGIKHKTDPIPNIEAKELQLQFSVDFKETVFMLGFVTFTKYVTELQQEVIFKVDNEHIIPEFDLIKYWFSKKLNTKQFDVKTKIILKGVEILEIYANSRVITKINPELIDMIKYQRTLALTKTPLNTNPDKSLFTSEDIFSAFSNEEGNIFNQSEEEILRFLLDKANIRNKKQLAYLAGSKQSKAQKLRYTLKPHFGFLFLAEGNKDNHFIWELLDSHATYIWSMNKHQSDIKTQLIRIENTINTIRASGRNTYKHAYRNFKLDDDIIFRVIDHDKIHSELIDGFILWKNKLNEQLT